MVVLRSVRRNSVPPGYTASGRGAYPYHPLLTRERITRAQPGLRSNTGLITGPEGEW
jgi:hypothetical protein